MAKAVDTHAALEKEFIAAVKKHLKEFGVEPKSIKFKNDLLEIAEHAVDQKLFLGILGIKTKFLTDGGHINAYTIDRGPGTLIFNVSNWRGEQWMKYPKVEEAFDQVRDRANALIQNELAVYFEKVAALSSDLPLSERIPKKLRKNFEMTESLADLDKWKAKIVLRNSAGQGAPKIGGMDEVGYTMIGIRTGTVIPIGRSDEHRRGYDLIHHLIEKKLIPEDTYHPIFNGHDYIDTKDPIALQAFKVWRKLGGKNIILNNYNGEGFQLTMDDYIRLNGDVKIVKGHLLPVGERFVANLQKLSDLVVEVNQGKSKDKAMYVQALKTWNQYKNEMERYLKEEKDITKEILLAESLGGVEGLRKIEALFFGFGSFKNEVHNQIREALKEEQTRSFMRHNDLRKIFGDLELAFSMLGAL